MNTRTYDIAKIEEDIAKGLVPREKGEALIEKLHKQSKDPDLEARRKKLIEDQRVEDVKYRVLRDNPEKLSKEELQRSLKHFSANPHEF